MRRMSCLILVFMLLMSVTACEQSSMSGIVRYGNAVVENTYLRETPQPMFVAVHNDLAGFKDVPDSHWAKPYIQRLYTDGVLTGYPDGTFKPDKEISLAEFVVLLCKATATKPLYIQDSHWAAGYMAAAIYSDLFYAGDFPKNVWNQSLNRLDMAYIIAHAVTLVIGEEEVKKPERFLSNIWDFASVPDSKRKEVAQVCAKGIVTGLPDPGYSNVDLINRFYGEKSATRADAAAIIVRLINPENRIIPSEVQWGRQATRTFVSSFLIQWWLTENWNLFNEAKDAFWGQEFVLCLYSPQEMTVESGNLVLDEKNRALLKRLYDECGVFYIQAYYYQDPGCPEQDADWVLLLKLSGNEDDGGQGLDFSSSRGSNDYGAPGWLMGDDYIGEWNATLAWDPW